MSQRPARYPTRPKVRLGDIIRTNAPMQWEIPKSIPIRIPIGTLGEAFPWETPDWGKCCAIKWMNFKDHPATKYYPMALARPGVDGWPPSIELVKRGE